MFPGAHAQVYRNDAGEPLGWDYPSGDDPYDPDDDLAWDDDLDDEEEPMDDHEHEPERSRRLEDSVRELSDALHVIVLDRRHRMHLAGLDPQALTQARAALSNADALLAELDARGGRR